MQRDGVVLQIGNPNAVYGALQVDRTSYTAQFGAHRHPDGLRGGGGPAPAGAQLLTELGANYVVVDPSCRFVAYESTNDHQGAAVRRAQLIPFLQRQECREFIRVLIAELPADLGY